MTPPDHQGTIHIVSLCDITRTLQQEWDQLAQNAQRANPFFSRWYLEPALEAFAQPEDVFLLIGRDHQGELILLAPIQWQTGYAKLPLRYVEIWDHLYQFQGHPLIHQAHTDLAWHLLDQWLDHHPRGARFMRFHNMPYTTTQGPETALPPCFAANRIKVQRHHERAVLYAQDIDLDSYLRVQYDGNKRKQFRRLTKKLNAIGPVSCDLWPVTPDTIGQFLTLEDTGWKKETDAGRPIAEHHADQKFFETAMMAGAAVGQVVLRVLSLSAQPVAMVVEFRCGNEWSTFKTAYNSDYASYSPGVQLFLEITSDILAQAPGKWVDSCAAPGHPMVDKMWRDRLGIAQINLATNHRVDRLLLGLAGGLGAMRQRLQKPPPSMG